MSIGKAAFVKAQRALLEGVKWATTEAQADALGGAVLLIEPFSGATDFSEYATGAQPSDWTLRWDAITDFEVVAAPGSYSGAVLRATQGVGISGRGALSWNPADDTSDIEILALATGATGGNMIALFARGSGDDSSDSGYALIINTASGLLRLANINNNNFTEVDTHSLGAVAGGEEWWLRFRLIGDNIKARAWRAGDAEPASWQIDYTDDDDTHVSGWAGVWTNVHGPDFSQFQVFAFALDGDTAVAP